jgi:hypothetical protein
MRPSEQSLLSRILGSRLTRYSQWNWSAHRISMAKDIKLIRQNTKWIYTQKGPILIAEMNLAIDWQLLPSSYHGQGCRRRRESGKEPYIAVKTQGILQCELTVWLVRVWKNARSLGLTWSSATTKWMRCFRNVTGENDGISLCLLRALWMDVSCDWVDPSPIWVDNLYAHLFCKTALSYSSGWFTRRWP